MIKKPMRLTDIEVTRAETYINDSTWIMQQKFDGARTLAVVEGQRVEFLASSGTTMKFAAAKLKLPAVEKAILHLVKSAGIVYAELDGELLVEDGIFVMFDVPVLKYVEAQEGVTGEETYLTRFSNLIALQPHLPETGELILPHTAYDVESKASLWEAINQVGVEGAIVKHVHAEYEYGTRTKNMLKLKLVKTADVVVTDVQRTFKADGVTLSHGNAELAVTITPEQDTRPWKHPITGRRLSEGEYVQLSAGTKAQRAKALGYEKHPRKLLPIGSASLIGKDLSIEVGSVVEVAYLYWTGEAMIQPRIVRKRRAEEKSAEECKLDQFPEYSREVVQA